MSSLTLNLRGDRAARTAGRIDMSGVVPDILLPLPIVELNRLTITVGAQVYELHELFDIEEGTRDRLILRGDLSCADFVGKSMKSGSLVVEGTVGHGLARQMRGGHLLVHGNAGDHVGSLMRAGQVEIRGDVGDYCAGAMAGERRGLCGGTLTVTGGTGRFVGFRMRRGLVIIQGAPREGCGSSMIAGTIVVGGAPPSPVGIGMRRGTLWCMTQDTPGLHPGFTNAEQIRLSYLPLLSGEVRRYAPELATRWQTGTPLYRSLGDRAAGGLGEVLWLIPSAAPESGW